MFRPLPSLIQALMTRILMLSTLGAGLCQSVIAADSPREAVQASRVSGDINLRYEEVDSSLQKSYGLTLRSRIGIQSGAYQGFSGSVSFEDVRDVMGIDDRAGLIPDPEVTELDTAFIQYKSDKVTAKAGRQVIALDNQRHVGHVGWRQDRQTFDAIRATYTPVEGASFDVAYVYKYNRIFAETADHDASSVLLNGSYATTLGKLTGYAYLLDNETTSAESDTYGVRLTGTKGSFSYTAEFATQSAGAFDAEYILLEAGMKISEVTARLGYELLGSDEGAYGFSTPLATGHAFNGWADLYLAPGADGLSDTYVSITGKAGNVDLTAAYHMFDSDVGSTDKGNELNLLATIPLASGITGGIKFATYSQGDPVSPTDRDKFWLWATYRF